jgi:hypothetical protein
MTGNRAAVFFMRAANGAGMGSNMTPGRRKLVFPLFVVAGIAYIGGGIIKFALHQEFALVFALCGVAFIVFGWLFARPR